MPNRRDDRDRAKKYAELRKMDDELFQQEMKELAELLLDIWEWKQQQKIEKNEEGTGSNQLRV